MRACVISIAVWLSLGFGLFAQSPSTGGDVTPDGTPAQIAFPTELRRANITSMNEGCCVFRSIHHAALWQSVPQLADFPEWLQKKRLPGGGYPDNVSQRITAISKERGMPEPLYLQVTGGKNCIDILKLAIRTGRMPGATYSYSPTGRYNRQQIAHMVNVVHATDQWIAVLDNNYLDQLEWIPTSQYLPVIAGRRTQAQGWVVVLLNPGPPPFAR